MIILGIILCIISIFILYKRLALIIFGKSANGYIIGYGNSTKGIRGIEAYNYKVRYEYKDNEYTANSLESVSVSNGSIPNKNLDSNVTIYFKENKLDVVTIKEFKGTTIIGVVVLLLGILCISIF